MRLKFLSGSSRRLENLLDLDQINYEKSYTPTYQGLNETCHVKSGNGVIVPLVVNQESLTIVPSSFQYSENIYSHTGHSVENGFSSSGSELPPLRSKAEGTPSFDDGEIVDAKMLCVDHCDAPTNILTDETSFSTEQNPVDFGHFQEGHYEILQKNECCKFTKGVNDDDSSSNHCCKDKLEEDEENDEMIGGVFVFPEEGRNFKLVFFCQEPRLDQLFPLTKMSIFIFLLIHMTLHVWNFLFFLSTG